MTDLKKQLKVAEKSVADLSSKYDTQVRFVPPNFLLKVKTEI